MSIEIPHYMDYYPNMSKILWKSVKSKSGDFENSLARIHQLANNSLHNIYGNFDAFVLDPSQPLNFSHLDYDHLAKDSHGPIMYLSFWALVTLVFIVVGYCWCLCNKSCCFLCVVAKADNHGYEEIKGEKKNTCRISCSVTGLVVLMSAWLLILLVLIHCTFGVIEETNQVFKGIRKDLNQTIRDMDLYLDTTRRQIKYTFQTCFWTMRDKIRQILMQCTGTGCGLVEKQLTRSVQDALDSTSVYVIKHSTELDIALSNVQAKILTVEKKLKLQYEQTLVDLSSSLHGFFISINLFYCLVFVMVLVGTIFFTFGSGRCLKTVGLLNLRCAVVFMFVLGIAAVFQLATFFVAAGVTAEIVCPAIRRLEHESVDHALQKRFIQDGKDLMKINEYKIPEYGVIIRRCKRDLSAYKAFDFKQAYDVQDILHLTDSFDIDISKLTTQFSRFLPPSINGLSTVQLLNTMNHVPSHQLHQQFAPFSNNIQKTNPDASQLNALLSSIPNMPIRNHLGNFIPKRISRNVAFENDFQESHHLVSLNPIEVVQEIKTQVQQYTRFVVLSIEEELGKCKPAYDAINATISLFCDKIVTPVASFWWILQFVPPTFAVIIITVIFLEKVL